MKLFLIGWLFFSIACFCHAQTIKLNKAIDVDTLKLELSFCDLLDSALRNSIEKSTRKAIISFNEKNIGFAATLDSSNTKTTLRLLVGELNYVTKKESFLWTGVGLATLVGHVYVISAVGWTLPILLIPSVTSKVVLEPSKGLFSNHIRHNKVHFNPSGYFRSFEKQEQKIGEKSEKIIYRLLKNLGKQDRKNHKE